MANKFTQLITARGKVIGMTSTTFQLPAETKERVDQIATTLGRSSSDVFRNLVEASLPELEAELEVYLDSERGKRSRK